MSDEDASSGVQMEGVTKQPAFVSLLNPLKDTVLALDFEMI